MKNKFPKHMIRRLSLYIMALFLFACCIAITSGFKKSINMYYTTSINTYKDSRWNTFYSSFKAAYRLGKTGLYDGSELIQNEIHTIDIDKLRNSLTNNIYNENFDQLLRKTLQENVFTSGGTMDENRNNIMVICNGKIIANYSHTDLYGIPYVNNEVIYNNDMREIIKDNFYNTELSLHALDQIEAQSDDLIVWQSTSPRDPNDKVYTYFNTDTLREIFENKGIDGFASYEVLIPIYITDYGNIFGDYDTSSDVGKNNKIILIQKLNLTDYFYNFNVNNDLVSNNKINELEKSYLDMKIMINIFEILLYIGVGAYIVFITLNINGMVDEILAIELTEN